MLTSLIALSLALAPQDEAAVAETATPAAEPAQTETTPEETTPAETVTVASGETADAKPTFSYNYVELALFKVNYDFLPDDGSGFVFGGSYAVTDMVNIVGSYSYETVDIGPIEASGAGLFLGVGAHSPIHPKVDVYGEVGLLFAEAEAFGITDTETGIGFEAGVRTMPFNRFEFDAALLYNSVGGSDMNLGLGIRGYVTEALSVGLSTILHSEGNLYGFGLRYGF